MTMPDAPHCTLCDLPTPDPPITDEAVEGVFCCQGCLEVHRLLGDLDEEQAAAVRERMNGAESEGASVPDDAAETFLSVRGMHCSTCEAFIETVAEQSPDVYRAEASYASDMVKLAYDDATLSEDELPDLVSRSGYSAAPVGEEAEAPEKNTVARLLLGGFFAMMAMLWYILFLYPTYFGYESFMDLEALEGTYMLANIWVATTVVLGYTGLPVLRSAFNSLRVLRPNMDLLVALAAISAYLYSSVVVLQGGTSVYFDVTFTIIMVVSLGKYYESRIKQRAYGLLSELTQHQVDEARRLHTDGSTTSVPLTELGAGDRVLVRAGERIPVDGTIVEGSAAINESLLTGEALPVTKSSGDDVVGGSTVTENALVVEVGEAAQSTLDRLVQLMWAIQAGRPGTQRTVDWLAAIFVPLVLVLAVAAMGIQLQLGAGFTAALLTALTVLIVSCPCAMGLATPLAIASGMREALQGGMVIKNASVFERAGLSDCVAFDKTGTLTTGTMRLLDTVGSEAALQRARAVEQRASHPIARAIVTAVPAPVPAPDVTDYQTHARGVEARVDGTRVLVGHPEWMIREGLTLSSDLEDRSRTAEEAAHVPVAVGWNGRVRGLLIVGDELRPDWQTTLEAIEAADRELIVITGDHEAAAEELRAHPAIDRVFAEVRPEAKSEIIRRLRAEGTVTMIGDGSNDAPALAEADLGIAFGPTALAADSADVVLTRDELRGIPQVFALTQQTRRRIYQNIGWAFVYNGVAIPLAITGLLNPLFAALAMASSSLLVVGNSSRRMRV